MAAIRTLKAIEAENRRATPAEQALLARYVGWGGLANAFRNQTSGAFKEGWEGRVKEIEDLLTGEELAQARNSTQNAHYTSKAVVDAMWKAAEQLGFSGGMVLEPSAGTGLLAIQAQMAGGTVMLNDEDRVRLAREVLAFAVG